MIELLAAIASDPSAIPLWGVALLAAAMYPIGFMLGSGCSPCCGCANCSTGSAAPDTITVTLDGFTDVSQGSYLCNLDFSACYGSGADGVVVAPGGDPDDDKGPISKVALTSGGGGYAKLGREEPTLTVTGSGTGATFTASLAQEQDACGLAYWRISSISVSGTGTGYTDQESLIISPAEGDTTEIAGAAKINSSRSDPTLTAAVAASSPGTGCALSVSVSQTPSSPSTWSVSGVSVTAGGTGYSEGDLVEFDIATGDVELYPASARVQVGRTTPAVSLSLFRISGPGSGTGGDISATLTQATSGITERDIWEITAITINNAGTGYEVGDLVVVTVTDGEADVTAFFYATVSSVGGSGELVAFTITSPGGYYKSTGVVVAVEVEAGGEYYHDDGVVGSVTLTEGGRYYRENPELPPSVATVTVSISQSLPSNGSGAIISATVDDDPGSGTFGQVTGLTIDDAGDDYLAWRWVPNACCGHQLNGKSFVLKRDILPRSGQVLVGGLGGAFVDAKCIWTHTLCGGWCPPFASGLFEQVPQTAIHTIAVGYRGPSLPPVAGIMRGVTGSVGSDQCAQTPCQTFFEAEEPISDCSDLSFSAQSFWGQTISVSPGGSYDYGNGIAEQSSLSCNVCCQGDELAPEEIEVQVQDIMVNRPGVPADLAGIPGGGIVAMPSVSGTYVLSSQSQSRFFWIGGFPNLIGFGIYLTPTPCQNAPCESCIKKCQVVSIANLIGTTGYLFFDEASPCAPLAYGSGCAPCQNCEPTPVCRPQQGRVFNVRWASANTSPQNLLAESKPAFVMTVL